MDFGVDVYIPTVSRRPRDPTPMRMQMEVPSSLEKPQYVGLPQIRHGTSLLTRLKPTEIIRITFPGRPFGSCLQFHFMPDKFHLMPDPTGFMRRRDNKYSRTFP